MIFKRYNQNLWGPLFVGPLGSCPLCPLLNPALIFMLCPQSSPLKQIDKFTKH